MRVARNTLEEVDVIIFIVDIYEGIGRGEIGILQKN